MPQSSQQDFSVGDRIKLHSLAGDKAATFNGVSGVIKSFIPQTGRWCVQTDSDSHGYGGKELAVRPVNLALAAPQLRKLPKQPHAARSASVPEWKIKTERCARQMGVALAETFRSGQDDLRGYLAMEKYDGYRALWNGTELHTRRGFLIPAPPSFTRLLPADTNLDGELWMGRVSEGGGVEKAMASFHTSSEDVWRRVSYIVFDAPSASGGFASRLALAAKRLAEHVPLPSHGSVLPSSLVRVAAAEPCEDEATAMRLLNDVESRGGEGLILRKGSAPFRAGRSRDLLKLKSVHTAEAAVLGWKSGKNALHVRCMETGACFDLTWGRSFERPRPSSVVTYRFMSRSQETNVPKHATIVCVHGKERQS